MDRRIKAVLQLLQNEWRGTVRVEELALRVNLGTSRLEHLFRRDAKMSIRDFIRERRLSEAASMLAATEEPVSVVSYRAGFPDVSNFNHAFKKKFGMSPRRYREQLRTQFECGNDQESAGSTK
jgi:AraC-like DNA-binding protein